MKNYRKPRQEENISRRARRASQKKVMLAGWIFLGVMLIAAIAAIILLLPGRDKTPDTEDRPLSVPQLDPGAGGSAFQTEQTAAPEEKRPFFGRMTDFVRLSETFFATVRKCYTMSEEKHATR